MKSIIAIVTVGALSMGLATQANAAWKLSPSGNFSATGATVLSGPAGTLNCTSTFSGKVSATGAGLVTHFSAVGDPGCSSLVATLPWPTTAVSATQIKFHNVTVGIPGFFTCGTSPAPTPGWDDASGLFGFNTSLANRCTTSGSVQSTPHILIVRK